MPVRESEPFDPYYAWLGIPPAEQPADHYRLLDSAVSKTTHRAIANAADRSCSTSAPFQLGEHASLSQTVLNELVAARRCLLDASRKAVYDESLRGRLHATGFAAQPDSLPTNAAEPTAPLAPPVAYGPDRPQSNAQRSLLTARSLTTKRNALATMVLIGVGGIAGVVLASCLLWYVFGIDVFGFAQQPGRQTAESPKPAAIKETPLCRLRRSRRVRARLQSPGNCSKPADVTAARASPTDAIPRAVAPFDAGEARQFQQAWANHFGLRAAKRILLGSCCS